MHEGREISKYTEHIIIHMHFIYNMYIYNADKLNILCYLASPEIDILCYNLFLSYEYQS